MIKYSIDETSSFSLDVSTPHETSSIEFEGEDNPNPKVKRLKKILENGWTGMFGHLCDIENSTALDLHHVVVTNSNFNGVRLIEGQDILDMYKDEAEPDPFDFRIY